MSKGITESRELIAAIGGLAASIVADLADGKISIIEGVALVKHFGAMRTAITGISEVPAELADLTEEERDTLLSDIKQAFISAGLSHRFSDAGEDVLRWAHDTVRTFVKIRSAPPSALVVGFGEADDAADAQFVREQLGA